MRFLRVECGVVLVLALAACGEVVGASSGPPGPTISAVSPDHGPLQGGNTVTITGTGFSTSDAGDPYVLVGGVAVTGVTVESDTSITFGAPAGFFEGGVVDITVSNQNGFATAPAAYRYNEVPLVLGVDPPLVAGAGGTEITITGRGFADLEAGDATVTTGGIAATNVTVVDDETITATVTAAPSIDPFTSVDLVVSNANGTITVEDALKYTDAGLITVERQCCAQRHRVQYIRLSDGFTSEIATTDIGVHGCVTSPAGEVLVLSRAGNGHRLGRLDLGTGKVESYADLRDAGGVAKHVTTLTFVGTTLYGWSRDDNRLVSINPTNGLVTVLGATSIGAQRPNTVGPRDASSVFFIDTDCETLDSINTTTGVLTTGPALSAVECAYYKGMVTTGGATYVAEYAGQRRIFSINTSTGARTEVARVPFQIGGLCTTPDGF